MKNELKQEKLAQLAGNIIADSGPEDFKYLTVDWIARKLGVSAPNLSRAFKLQNRGRLLKECILMTKMNFCQNLIKKNPDITVKELAELADYSSSKYFIKLFKNFSKVTPGTYIKLTRISNGTYFALLRHYIVDSPEIAREKGISFQQFCENYIKFIKSRKRT